MPDPLRVVVADDEPLGRKRLLDLLARAPGVAVVGVAETGDAAAAAVAASAPDVVFLDVRMPGRSGLDLAQALATEAPVVVLVTAHAEHAVDAFGAAVLDYLLKPFDDERFAEALARVRAAVARRTDAAPTYETRLAVDVRGARHYVPLDRVDAVVADGVYAVVHAGAERFVLRESLASLAERLDPAVFLRVHRSAIVRLDRVARVAVTPAGTASAVLVDGTRLPVSRRQRDTLRERLRRLP